MMFVCLCTYNCVVPLLVLLWLLCSIVDVVIEVEKLILLSVDMLAENSCCPGIVVVVLLGC